MKKELEFYVPILAVIGGLVALLSVFYFVESFSYSVGYDNGFMGAIGVYNVSSAANTVLPALTATISTFRLGLHIVYAMLFLPIIMLGIGAFWMFGSSKGRTLHIIMMTVGIVFLLMVTIITENFHFSGPLDMILAAYAGALLCTASGGYFLYARYSKAAAPRNRAVRSIEIDPAKPYSNMDLIAKRLFSSFSGEVKILDMHFDTRAVQNLSALVSRSNPRFKKILALTASDRTGDSLRRDYNELKAELANFGIGFEIRIMNDSDLAEQHERLILDDSKAYKIPPLNIINRKNEHIVSVNYRQATEHFDRLWSRGAKLENFGKGNSGKKAALPEQHDTKR